MKKLKEIIMSSIDLDKLKEIMEEQPPSTPEDLSKSTSTSDDYLDPDIKKLDDQNKRIENAIKRLVHRYDQIKI